MISIDEGEEIVRCYMEDIVLHHRYHSWTLGLVWNRFIPGRCNPMKLKVVADKWEQSEAAFRGAKLTKRENFVDVLVYTENYPRVLRANVLDILPNASYKIGDLRRDLPDGIELAPKYDKANKVPIFKFEKNMRTVVYDQIM
jgi:hypothetical protein